MKKIKSFILKFELAYNLFWFIKFHKIHPLIKLNWQNKNRLRIVLGIGRSGTTWLGATLNRTSTPIRYFEEPTIHVEPSIKMLWHQDDFIVKFQKKISRFHRFSNIFLAYTHETTNHNFLDDRFYKRNDPKNKYILIKEVHGLLLTEAMVKKLKCPFIILIREPLYVIDSLFHAQTHNTVYLKNEFIQIQKQAFLKHYFKKQTHIIQNFLKNIKHIQDPINKNILEKYVTIDLINRMFLIIDKKYSNTLLYKYEELIQNPNECFMNISAFFDFDWEKNSYDFSKTKLVENKSPYDISINSKKQINKPFKFLKEDHLNFIENFIREHNYQL